MPATHRLDEFQQAFAAALADPDARVLREDIAELARQPGFAVYRNTTLKGCVDALQANYPAVCRLVGEEWFRACAAVFVRANWPTDAALVHYGVGFADFLAAFEPAAELPYLPLVAQIDRYWTEAHVAADELPVEAAALARCADLRIRPHASARWAWSDDTPVYTIWTRNRASGRYDDSPFDWQGEGVLLVRPRDRVEALALDRGGRALLDAFAHQTTVAAAVAASRLERADADAALHALASAGALVVATAVPFLESRA